MMQLLTILMVPRVTFMPNTSAYAQVKHETRACMSQRTLQSVFHVLRDVRVVWQRGQAQDFTSPW